MLLANRRRFARAQGVEIERAEWGVCGREGCGGAGAGAGAVLGNGDEVEGRDLGDGKDAVGAGGEGCGARGWWGGGGIDYDEVGDGVGSEESAFDDSGRGSGGCNANT